MSIVIFILILAILIIVHEYGHFIVAKLWGIRVDEFGLGYPPRAKKLFKKNGTLFTLNWIPFGGFVKIFGEDPDDDSINGPDKNRALISKPKIAQASVMFAGPLFNFIFAWLVILVALFIGMPSYLDGSVNENYVQDKKLVISDVLPNSPASNSDLIPGDVVFGVSVSGEAYEGVNEEQLRKLILDNDGEVITLDIIRGEENLVRSLPVGDIEIDGKPAIGVGLVEVGVYKPAIGLAFIESLKITGTMIGQIAYALGDLVVDAFRGQADISTLTGPVGIVSLVGDASHLGFVYLLTFVALISINLGIINLIPFPALDGGRILFIIIEKIKGSRINPKISNSINSIGFIILITLMFVVTFRDVINLF